MTHDEHLFPDPTDYLGEEGEEAGPETPSLQDPLAQRVLELVNRPGYHPVKPKVIAKKLQLDKSEMPRLRRVIKLLARQGLVAYGRGHLVRPAKEGVRQARRIVGIFRKTDSGYGFVRPRGEYAAGLGEDVYIASAHTADAVTGDLVLVELTEGTGGAGPRGQIVRVLERQRQQFVGTYFEAGSWGYVEVDGGLFPTPIFVGDPGAKGARPEDKVVIELIRYPTPYAEGEGVIVEVLGERGRPGLDTLMIMREFGLPESFPEDVLEEARQQAQNFREEVPPDRLDLTGLTVITIDPPDARDFDDAVSLEKREDGSWRLGVHIADVAYFVPPKSALDREAFERATSVYLPDRVIPMLPEPISNGVASLQPGKIRFTKSVFIEFTPEGIPTYREFHRSVIRSSKRLTYEEVDEFLADPARFESAWGPTICRMLMDMRDLARILRARRRRRGALELILPEIKLLFDDSGGLAGAKIVEHTESHQIIEEFMLAANEAVAEFLQDKGLHFLRRVHKDPLLRKLRDLTDFVKGLGIETESLESRFAIQRLLEAVAGRPEQHAVHYAVLRSLQRAIYSPRPEGHYALATDTYCHFTAPIRRYPDLTVHRLLDAVLDNRKPVTDFDRLVLLGEHCSRREERAEIAERELIKLKLLGYLQNHIGMEMEGVITGVERYGIFIQGVDLPAEGLVHISTLDDDFYRFDRKTHSLVGYREGHSYRLGDRVRVKVARVDLDRRQLDFRLVGHRAGRVEARPLRQFRRRHYK
ncbi:MAG: ribonuclease R [Thermoguttaceae bacterium]|nr:ribonuclease R [Thermoguttaceae bacterium]MDW8078368.1 ribonuclease R [Thermoguttaceae bacterium]